jgi:hypothetical protein
MHLAFDQYTLALGLLDDEPDAHRILADLLDEQGERGLARWARRGRPQHRTEMLLYLLPYFAIVQIGCDAITTALEKWGDPQRVGECIRAIRHRTQSNNNADLEASLHQLGALAFPQSSITTDYFDGVAHVRPGLQVFHALVRCAQSAHAAEQQGEERIVRARTHEAATALRRCLKVSCSNPHWRIARTRAALASLQGL